MGRVALDRPPEVPAAPAVYVVYRHEADHPAFLAANPGGRFKGQDPTVPIETLQTNWVSGALAPPLAAPHPVDVESEIGWGANARP